jgi:hypothetical protein
MKNSTFSRLAAMTAFVMLFAAMFQQASASGTRAGTKLTSTATINYNDKNGAAMAAVNGAVSVYVAHKPASTLVVGTTDQEGYDGGFVTYTMTVTNNGNGQDKFQFLPDSASYLFVDSVGFYKDAGFTQHLLGTAKNVLQDTVTHDGSATVYAKVYLKADPSYPSYLNASTAIKFYTRSTANNSDTTYLTEDGLQTRVVSTSFVNALSSQVTRNTKVKQSRLALSTTNAAGYAGAPGVGTGHRPGATVSYKATVVNSGHGQSKNTVLRVDYPSGMSFASGNNWIDNTTYATYNFGDVDPGETATTASGDSLLLTLADNNAQLEGSTRATTMSVAYDDSTNGVSARTRNNGTTPSSFTVKYKYFAATIAYNDTTESTEPGDSVTFRFTITNNSNGDDYVDTRFIDATQYPDSFVAKSKWYGDENGDNTLTVGVDSIFSSNADGYRSTFIARGASMVLFARTVAPSGMSSGAKNLVYYGSSARDSATSGNIYLGGSMTPLIAHITDTRTRILHDSISAGVAGAASIAPGGSASFYVDIVNDGTGKATNVVVTDDIGALSVFAPFGGTDTIWVWNGVAALPAGEAKVVSPTASYTTDDLGYSQVKKDGTGYVIKIAELLVGDKRRIRYRVTLQ